MVQNIFLKFVNNLVAILLDIIGDNFLRLDLSFFVTKGDFKELSYFQ